jgi:hypothetical protein
MARRMPNRGTCMKNKVDHFVVPEGGHLLLKVQFTSPTPANVPILMPSSVTAQFCRDCVRIRA